MKAPVSSSRDRRALVLLAGVLVFFFAYKYALKPLLARHVELREEVASQRDLLASELGLLETASAYRDIYGQADSTLRVVTPRLFAVQDDELATIALQQYVDNVARSSSVYVAGTNTRPAVGRSDGLKRLQIDISAESDLEGIMKMLDRLESGPRLVQVSDLALRPGKSQAGLEQNDDVLMLTASIVGYAIDSSVIRGDAPPPPPPARGRAGQ